MVLTKWSHQNATRIKGEQVKFLCCAIGATTKDKSGDMVYSKHWITNPVTPKVTANSGKCMSNSGPE